MKSPYFVLLMFAAYLLVCFLIVPAEAARGGCPNCAGDKCYGPPPAAVVVKVPVIAEVVPVAPAAPAVVKAAPGVEVTVKDKKLGKVVRAIAERRRARKGL